MKKRNIKRIILSNLKLLFVALAGGIIGSLSVGYAANIYYNGIEVGYDNTTTKMASTNVQDALDELFDVADVSNRVSTLEGYFQNSPTSYFDGDILRIAGSASSTSSGSWIEMHANGVDSLGIGVATDGNAIIAAKASDGTFTRPLNLRGNPVNINGVNITNVTTGTATINTTNTGLGTGGSVIYYKIGRIVIVSINQVYPKLTGKNILASGLPTSSHSMLGTLTTSGAGGSPSVYTIGIDSSSGNIHWYWPGSVSTLPVNGQLVYISAN